MFNLLLAFVAGIAVALGIRLGGFSLVASIVPGTLVFVGAYVGLALRVTKKLQALTAEAHKELSVPASSVKEQRARAEKAVKILETGFSYGRWQFLVAAQVHGAIGQIKYMMKDYEAAKEHFSKAHPRDYMSMALTGAMHFQRKAYDDMRQSFEKAVKAGKKEPVVWAVYAWCLQQTKDSAGAMKVLARSVEANPSDEKLKAGLTALQNDKKLKMKAFEPMWWTFGLESPPVQQGRPVRWMQR